MVPKRLNFTRHAENARQERHIDVAWVAEAVSNPDWIEADTTTSGGQRRFKAIAAFGERVLRVACLEEAEEIRILTVFFDRKARPPK